MALATQPDVEARLGRDLSASELLRVDALLDDASAIVAGYAGTDFEPAAEPPADPYPPAVTGVVAKMVARVLSQGSGPGAGMYDSQSAGPFAVKFSAAVSSGDMWLTAADKLALRPYRVGGGLRSVGLVGSRYEITETP